MNLVTWGMDEVADNLEASFFGPRPEVAQKLLFMPLMMIGPIGVGKTTMVHKYAKDHDLGWKEVRLSNHESTDLTGLPKVREIDNRPFSAEELAAGKQYVVDWIQTGLLPDARDANFKEKGILFLDEITNASRAVQCAAWQLTDSSRSVGQYKLPDGWKVVLAGNGPDDGGAFCTLTSALINRGMTVRVEPNVENWTGWANRNNIAPEIIGFVNENNSMLWGGGLPIEAVREGTAMPTPRAWENASILIDALDIAHKGEKTYATIIRQIGAVIGEQAAAKFAAFYVMREKMIDIDAVADGKIKITGDLLNSLDNTVIYIQKATVVQTAYKAIVNDWRAGFKDAEAYKRAKNCLDFIAKIGAIALDMSVAMIRELYRQFREASRDTQHAIDASERIPSSLFATWQLQRLDDISNDIPDFDQFYTNNKALFD